MSYSPAGAYYYIKQPQFVEESSFGVTPTSPTFINCGAITDLAFSLDVNEVKYRQLGSRDMYNEIKVGESYSIVMKYQPFNTTLMKYGTEYANASATGNIAKSLSILWSQNINGVENYYLAVGCRTERIDIDITENAVMCTQTFIAKTVNTPTTTFTGAGGTGTPTYAA